MATPGRPTRSGSAHEPHSHTGIIEREAVFFEHGRLEIAIGFTFVVTLDCADPQRLAPFWAEALHYRANSYHAPYLTLTDPTGKSPELILQKVPEPKQSKNRMHLDLFGDDIEREAHRMESLGARRISKEPMRGPTGDRWIVMADPDGNEFCVCEGDVTTLEG